MPPKALKQILFKLETTADFLAKIDPEYKKLVGKYICFSCYLSFKVYAIALRYSLDHFYNLILIF